MLKISKYNIEIYILITITVTCINFSTGLEFITNIKKNIDQYSNYLEGSKNLMRMPTIQQIVGDDTISYFGEFPAPMVYNNFNYIPSPSTISFVGWNKWIIDKDVTFYKNRSKPDYLLLHLYNDASSIAEQFVITDSARAQLEIMYRYEPVIHNHIPLEENARLLLKKRNINKNTMSFKNIEKINSLLNEWIDVPKSGGIIQAKINLVDEPSIISLLSLAYRGPLYSIEYVLDNGEVMEKRFIQNKAAQGFLVAPYIYTNDDYLAVMSEKYWGNYLSNKSYKKGKSIIRKIEKFKIKCLAVLPTGRVGSILDRHSNKYGCAKSLRVEYFMVNGLDFGRSNFQMPIITENDILGKWSINNYETCVFKKDNQLYFLNEYNDRARADLNGTNIWIKKWKVGAKINLDKKAIIFNNGTKWVKAEILKNDCGK